MKRQSLRLRLILGAAVWIAVALLLAGIAIGYLFTASAERSACADLSATMSRLVALIDSDSGEETPVLARVLPDPRYDTPMSGIYWQIKDLASRKIIRSRSLWDHVLNVSSSEEGGRFSTAKGPAGQSLLAFSLTARYLTTKGERRYEVIVAQDRSILDETITRFGQDLAVALLILGAVLIVAAILQVHLGLSSFRKLRQDIENIRRGAASSVDTAYPSEVMPLVSEVNELLALQQKSMDFARSRAADLAHGLKTPLAVLGTVAYELEENGDKRNSGLILELTSEMGDRIDYQMRLTRLRQRTRMHTLSASLGVVVRRAISVLEKTNKGEKLDWMVDVDDSLDLDIDERDLIELIGVILENSAEWATSLVNITARQTGESVILRVCDDGPGIKPSDIALIGVRGKRFDEKVPGTGLGLSIACEVISLNNGTIEFEQSVAGGLSVIIRLPTAHCGAVTR